MLDQWLEAQRINGGPHGFECVGREALSRMWAAAVVPDQERNRVFARWAMEALLALETIEPDDYEDGGEHLRMLMDRGRRLVDAVVLPKVGPLRNEDGSLHQKTLRIGGKSHRCSCGCNVFHHPDASRLDLYECNGCGQQFEAE